MTERLADTYWLETGKLGLGHIDQSQRVIGSVSAETRMFFSEWSETEGDLHGSDVMLACGNLIDELLEGDEHLTRIDRLRWNAPMKHELKLTAALTPIASTNLKIFTAEFTTSKGKKIYIVGDDTNEPITRSCCQNPLAKSVMDAGYPYKVNTHPMQPDLLEKLNARKTGLILSTFLDVINLSLNNQSSTGWLPDGDILIAGFENLEIPSSEVFKEKLQIEINVPEDWKHTKKGYRIMPIHMSISKENGELISTGICNYAVPQP